MRKPIYPLQTTHLFLLLTLSGCTKTVDRPEQDIQLRAEVDQRVELLSIVFRLAGSSEYNTHYFEKYTTAIEQHFLPFKNHPVVALAKEVAANQYVGYDAVMAMAIHLESPPALQPVIPFAKNLPEARWGEEKARQFVQLLQSFYQNAHCEDFFNSQQPLYETAAERFQHLLAKVDLPWFKEYYGDMPDAAFHLVLGLANGGGNYGPKVVYPDGKEALYAIMGTWKTDSTGMPVYEDDVLPVIIHEFNHSFVNPLIREHEAQLACAGQELFNQVSEQMKAMAYANWKTMLYEALVRAIVIRYFIQHDVSNLAPTAMIEKEKAKGFFWIEQLNDLLEEYENKRDIYPSLASFMPQIVEFYNQLVPQIDVLQPQVAN